MHVNKKGRPVSQCQHCRGLRKARAQHVKCDCAENAHTKENCPLDAAEKGMVFSLPPQKFQLMLLDHAACCCGHGARCNCALKKEHLDTVPEDLPNGMPCNHPQKDTHKHRLSNLNNHKSEMTVFQNGHHKPVHKINDAHNRCGAPYKIPARSNTVHGHKEIAQKSSDSLPLTKSALTGHESPQHHESVTSAPQPVRQVKSEHGSPELNPVDAFDLTNNGLIIPRLDPTAYSYSPFDNTTPPLGQLGPQDYPFPEQFPDNWFMSYEQAQRYEPGMNTAGTGDSNPEVDWSKYNFATDNIYNANNNLNGHPPSYGSHDHYSHLSHPGLTSSSGDVSVEGDDYTSVSRPTALRDNSQLSNDITDHDDTTSNSEAYRLSSASSYLGTPQAQILASNNLRSMNIDDYIKQAEEQTRLVALQNAQAQNDRSKVLPIHGLPMPNSQQPQPAYNSPQVEPMHPFTVHEAQTYAHMGSNEEENAPGMTMGGKPFMTMSGFDDPMFSRSPLTPGVGLDDDDDEFALLR